MFTRCAVWMKKRDRRRVNFKIRRRDPRLHEGRDDNVMQINVVSHLRWKVHAKEEENIMLLNNILGASSKIG